MQPTQSVNLTPTTNVSSDSAVVSKMKEMESTVNQVEGFTAKFTGNAKEGFEQILRSLNQHEVVIKQRLQSFSRLFERDLVNRNVLLIVDNAHPANFCYYAEGLHPDVDTLRQSYNHDMCLCFDPQSQRIFKDVHVVIGSVIWEGSEKYLEATIESSHPYRIELQDSYGKPKFFDNDGNLLLQELVKALYDAKNQHQARSRGGSSASETTNFDTVPVKTQSPFYVS